MYRLVHATSTCLGQSVSFFQSVLVFDIFGDIKN